MTIKYKNGEIGHMKIIKILGIAIIGTSLMVGCNNQSVPVDTQTTEVEQTTDVVEQEENEQEEIRVLTQEEVKERRSTLKDSGDIEGYVATTLLETQVTNGENPYNVKDCDGNLVNCNVTSKIDGSAVEIVLDVPANRDTIDIEQLETLVFNNIKNFEENDTFDITLILNDIIVMNSSK